MGKYKYSKELFKNNLEFLAFRKSRFNYRKYSNSIVPRVVE
jgi:hypothetical protein